MLALNVRHATAKLQKSPKCRKPPVSRPWACALVVTNLITLQRPARLAIRGLRIERSCKGSNVSAGMKPSRTRPPKLADWSQCPGAVSPPKLLVPEPMGQQIGEAGECLPVRGRPG